MVDNTTMVAARHRPPPPAARTVMNHTVCAGTLLCSAAKLIPEWQRWVTLGHSAMSAQCPVCPKSGQGGAIYEYAPLRLDQLAFLRDALMLFVCTFDAIFELAPIVWELLGHFVGPAWHIATDCGPKSHGLTDVEFVGGHRLPQCLHCFSRGLLGDPACDSYRA
jgi:hypothetical protein